VRDEILHKKICSEYLKGRNLLEDLAIDGSIILKLVLRNIGWTGFIWLGMLSSGRLLWTWFSACGFHKLHVIS
jgi:hypothetical protein